MSDSTNDEGLRDVLKARIAQWGEELKTELAAKVDQALDELGARIDGK